MDRRTVPTAARWLAAGFVAAITVVSCQSKATESLTIVPPSDSILIQPTFALNQSMQADDELVAPVPAQVQPTATQNAFLIRTGSTSAARTTATWRSAGRLISVLARHWRESKVRKLLKRCFAACLIWRSNPARSCGGAIWDCEGWRLCQLHLRAKTQVQAAQFPN